MPTKSVHHVDLRIPMELWREIKTLATSEKRSINSQIIVLLEKATMEVSKNGVNHDK